MKIEDEIKGKFRNNYHKAVINLTYTANILNFHFQKLVRSYGLTTQQYNVLRILRGAFPKKCSLKYIKRRMLDKKSDVSRIVDRLFNNGLVMRKEAITDRREKDIRITDTGMKILADMDECERKVDDFLINLSEGEVSELNRLLDKIRDDNFQTVGRNSTRDPERYK